MSQTPSLPLRTHGRTGWDHWPSVRPPYSPCMQTLLSAICRSESDERRWDAWVRAARRVHIGACTPTRCCRTDNTSALTDVVSELVVFRDAVCLSFFE